MKARLNYAALSFIAAGALSISQTSFAQVPRSLDNVEVGTVTSIAADHATIKTVANEPLTIVFSPNTLFGMKVGTGSRMAKLTDIQVGNTINVMGHLDPDGITKHANLVTIYLTAADAQKALASPIGRLANSRGMGITNVPGKVTAIDGMHLTIDRSDHVSQVVEVNKNTSFFKGPPQAVAALMHEEPDTTSPSGAENITLANIKVGDRVYTRGALKFPATVALKDNIFVASKFGVTTASLTTAALAAASAEVQSTKGVFVNSIQAGIITAIEPNLITIKNGAGEVFEILFTAQTTRLDRAGQPTTFADINIGDSLGGGGYLHGKTLNAVAVGIDDGGKLQAYFDYQRKMAEGVGKTNIAGHVTAIDKNKLTITRTDNVVQVIDVDENTLFHKAGRNTGSAEEPNGASITLADVKVGDRIFAAGSLKNDVFVAKGLTVIDVR